MIRLDCQTCYGYGQSIDYKTCPRCDGTGKMVILKEREYEELIEKLEQWKRWPSAGELARK